MSRESLNWLNTNTLIGFTNKRGTAWHWRAEEQGEQSNHYPGAVPLADVQDRLFHWTADSRRIAGGSCRPQSGPPTVLRDGGRASGRFSSF